MTVLVREVYETDRTVSPHCVIIDCHGIYDRLGCARYLYSNLPGEGLRRILAFPFAIFGAALLLWYLFSAKRTRPLLVFFAAFLLLVAWWSTIPPMQDRDWAPEYAKPAYATINGDLMTIHNIRNFNYRTETDFTPRYYDKTFDLLSDSVDLIASYWMRDAIADIFQLRINRFEPADMTDNLSSSPSGLIIQQLFTHSSLIL